MNLAIINHTNKTYQPYIYVSPDQENFLNGLVCKIISKSDLHIMIQADIQFKDLDDRGYQQDDVLIDRLANEYNSKASNGEKILEVWKKF